MQPNNEKLKLLAIIPARGGSKGIPRKNVRDLCGKPLIAYTIDAALKSKLIDRVVVSTEDEEVASVSKYYGAEVPFFRPESLAQDRSNVEDSIEFTVERLKSDGYTPKTTVVFFPTHLFRTPQFIDYLLGKALQGYSPVQTVKKVNLSNSGLFFSNGGRRTISSMRTNLIETHKARMTYFRINGLFSSRNYENKHMPYLYTVQNPISLIDVDSLSDFFLAEEIIKNRLFNFEDRPNAMGLFHYEDLDKSQICNLGVN